MHHKPHRESNPVPHKWHQNINFLYLQSHSRHTHIQGNDLNYISFLMMMPQHLLMVFIAPLDPTRHLHFLNSLHPNISHILDTATATHYFVRASLFQFRTRICTFQICCARCFFFILFSEKVATITIGRRAAERAAGYFIGFYGRTLTFIGLWFKIHRRSCGTILPGLFVFVFFSIFFCVVSMGADNPTKRNERTEQRQIVDEWEEVVITRMCMRVSFSLSKSIERRPLVALPMINWQQTACVVPITGGGRNDWWLENWESASHPGLKC